MVVQNPSDIQENQLIRFLKQLGFSDVNGGHDFIIGERQIDAAAGHESTLLIFECTTQNEGLTLKIDQFRGSANQKIHALKQHEKYRRYNKHRLILVVDDQPITEALIQRGLASAPEIVIWDKQFLSYYQTLQKSIKQYAKFSLLAELGIKPDNSEQLEMPALSIDASGGAKYRLFVFSVLASDLTRFCYVARRQAGGENYYQRMVKHGRLVEIAKYIEKGMIFPNSIVVALHPNAWTFKPVVVDAKFPRWETFGTLTLKDRFDSCWIIDGQHRLFAHTHTTTPGRIIVTAFANITEEKQAEYFLDINREAKKVDADLLWDLLGSTNPGSTEGIISKAVKSMVTIPNGFFEDNINIPSIGIGQFSFNNICTVIKEEQLAAEQIPSKSHIVKNPFWNRQTDETVSQLSKGLNQYFSSLDQLLTPGTRERIYSDGMIAVLISLYKLIVVDLGRRPTADELSKYMEHLASYLNNLPFEDVSQIRKGLTSRAGRTAQRNDFVYLLQAEYSPDFALGMVPQEPSLAGEIGKLEFELNRCVNSYMINKHGENWINNQNVFRNQDELRKMKEQSLRSGREPWEHLNFLSSLTGFVTTKQYWDEFYGEYFRKAGVKTQDETLVLGRKLWDFRSNNIHDRSIRIVYTREEEALIKYAYRMFKIAIQAMNNNIEETTTMD